MAGTGSVPPSVPPQNLVRRALPRGRQRRRSARLAGFLRWMGRDTDSAWGNVNQLRKWRGPRRWIVVQVLASVLGGILLAWLAWSALRYAVGPSPYAFDPNNRCTKVGPSCGAIIGIVTPLLSIALGFTVFMFLRLRWLLRRYKATAKARPEALVQTAGVVVGTIVGRQELCAVTIDDLRERGHRPRVIVGGVGVGKTAVLVRLTKMLAEHGAVPVPIRLRDARDSLDFRELAYKRFKSELADRVTSDAEADVTWRRLYKHRRIVVLADGLEEALVATASESDRDSLIRQAIDLARQQHVPLVVTSRPHAPLHGMGANITELEPLSEEAALEYVGKPTRAADANRIDWIVETAEVAEAPLYLQITRTLHDHDRLHRLSPADDATDLLNSRSADRAGLRYRLLRSWEVALVHGYLEPELPLDYEERNAALEQLGALACVGLLQDTLVIDFADLIGTDAARSDAARRRRDGTDTRAVPAHDLLGELEIRMEMRRRPVDIRLAATHGAQLNLVDSYGQGVRFHHSLMQAYLGTRFMDYVLRQPRDFATSFQQPSREFLISLVLYSRKRFEEAALRLPAQSEMADAPDGEGWLPSPAPAAIRGEVHQMRARRGSRADTALAPIRAAVVVPHADAASNVYQQLVRVLQNAVNARREQMKRPDAKVIDLYRTALEIDCLSEAPQHRVLAADIAKLWNDCALRDPQVHEAALELLRAWGGAARTIWARYDERQKLGLWRASGRCWRTTSCSGSPAPATCTTCAWPPRRRSGVARTRPTSR